MTAFTDWWLPLLILVALVVAAVLFYREDRRVARELARRPLREFQVAGLDRDVVVSRHATFGPLPLVSRRELRRLDRARDTIARWEAEQARGND
ncbi:hypothetical protein [Nocardioides sp.]|uniref:hypothetical protein n=1 Tax=Nocardioides sp. TaxID=35761 RepID=UPI002608ADF8|nr:hypothetical protein [uncultured Nocardioides sp.]